MTPARIATLLHPFLERTLPEVFLQQISTYIDLLLRWNAQINLTAIRDPDQIVTRHFGESFFLARHLFPAQPSVGRTLLSAKPSPQPAPLSPQPSAPAQGEEAQPKAVRVLDIGSGAGFPGLPLKIWAPHISLTLVESNHKKAAFLNEVIRSLTLTNVNVNTERAEALVVATDPPFPPADLATLRAVERFDTILPTVTHLVNPSGRLALLIGTGQLRSLQTLAPDFRTTAQIPVPQSKSRVLSIMVR